MMTVNKALSPCGILLANLMTSLISASVLAGAKDDPLLTMLSIDHFEVAPGRYDAMQAIEGELWAGYDFHKLVLDWDVEREDGHITESDWGLKYRTALSPFWDMDVGIERSFKGHPKRNWGVVHFLGTAPYFIDVDLGLKASNEGRLGAELSLEQEWMLTQRWVFMPGVELEAYSKDDESNKVGRGLSSLAWSGLLGFEVVREFTPYIGVRHFQHYGDTARFIRHEGEPSSETLWVIGFEAWL